jgi:hypothetical protein
MAKLAVGIVVGIDPLARKKYSLNSHFPERRDDAGPQSGSPEHVAQVKTRRTAPLDQSVADPSSLPASRLPDRMNQRTPCASTGEFFNTIRQQQSFAMVGLSVTLSKTVS